MIIIDITQQHRNVTRASVHEILTLMHLLVDYSMQLWENGVCAVTQFHFYSCTGMWGRSVVHLMDRIAPIFFYGANLVISYGVWCACITLTICICRFQTFVRKSCLENYVFLLVSQWKCMFFFMWVKEMTANVYDYSSDFCNCKFKRVCGCE